MLGAFTKWSKVSKFGKAVLIGGKNTSNFILTKKSEWGFIMMMVAERRWRHPTFFLFSLPPHDWTSLLQTQVRKSAPSRARSQGERTLPLRRPPNLLCSRCPVPAAATPPLNPGHPAPFSAKLFHQVPFLFNWIVYFLFLSSVFSFVLPPFLSFFSSFFFFLLFSTDAFGVSATTWLRSVFVHFNVCLVVWGGGGCIDVAIF